jgi:hypothetical protein
MTVMTPEHEAVLRELILLAEGDSDLVWEAFRKSADEDHVAPLEDVIKFISDRIRTKHASHGTEQACAAIS